VFIQTGYGKVHVRQIAGQQLAGQVTQISFEKLSE
jgi:hypothetical protein